MFHQNFRFKVFQFVKAVADGKGLIPYFPSNSDPNTIFLVQPIDPLKNEGPSGAMVREFVNALNAELADSKLSLPIYIEACNTSGIQLPADISDHLPNIVHLVRIRALQ